MLWEIMSQLRMIISWRWILGIMLPYLLMLLEFSVFAVNGVVVVVVRDILLRYDDKICQPWILFIGELPLGNHANFLGTKGS